MPPAQKPFYVPTEREINDAEVTKFMLHVNKIHGLKLADYDQLHRWSIEHMSAFYEAVWKRYGIIGDIGELPLVNEKADITDTASFVPRARLNWAENLLLSHRNARSSAKLAVVGAVEGTSSNPSGLTKSYTYAQLYDEVNYLSNALRKLGLKPKDTVSAYSSNTPEAVVAVTASTSLGAVFSSVSIEVMSSGCLDRLESIKPKVIFVTTSYLFAGEIIDAKDRISEVVRTLAKKHGLKHLVLIDHLKAGNLERFDTLKNHGVEIWKFEDLVAWGKKDAPAEIKFFRGPAMHPLWILFSSGTTGKPKGLIHNTIGMVMHGKIVNVIHQNCKPSDLQMQASTLSWMMWNNALNVMQTGAGIVTYDGNPLRPMGRMFELMEQTGATVFGTSPRYLSKLLDNKFRPNKVHDTSTLRAILTAGSPLKPALYEFIKIEVMSRDQFVIANGTGGTDVCGALVTNCPTVPIYAGIIQRPVLGVSLEAWSEDTGGKSTDGVGSMVVTKPLLHMPLGLINDPQKELYKQTYFSDFLPKVVWNMADSIIKDERGINVIGRADAILNPGGVRIGPSEIYEVVDPMFESVAVPLKGDGDEKVVLFIVTKDGKQPTEAEKDKIRKALKEQRSFRHVPSIIAGVSAVPYNSSAKKLEVAVRKLLNGMDASKINTTACINPECLKEYSPYHPAIAEYLKKQSRRSKL